MIGFYVIFFLMPFSFTRSLAQRRMCIKILSSNYFISMLHLEGCKGGERVSYYVEALYVAIWSSIRVHVVSERLKVELGRIIASICDYVAFDNSITCVFYVLESSIGAVIGGLSSR